MPATVFHVSAIIAGQIFSPMCNIINMYLLRSTVQQDQKKAVFWLEGKLRKTKTGYNLLIDNEKTINVDWKMFMLVYFLQTVQTINHLNQDEWNKM